jgi:peptide/nickel transport system ATP-binding protein
MTPVSSIREISLESDRHSSPEMALRRAEQPLLEVKEMRVGFSAAAISKSIVDEISFRIYPGEVVALVGESGSGKSMTALSLMRLLPAGLAVTHGQILFGGEDVLTMPSAQLNQLRGGRIGMLFQHPQSMLDPTSRVGTQVAEGMRIHRRISRSSARSRVVELLREVGIADPNTRIRCFSHELSGGMAQRVMIASALSANPELLIADEPTTALDVTVQAQILKLIDNERRKRKVAVLLITHDLSVVSALAERIIVMYAGRIVEEGPTQAILHAPQHPYTKALVQCSLLQADNDGNLITVPGGPVQFDALAEGCRFHPRCTAAAQSGVPERCATTEPSLLSYNEHCKARCWAVEASSHRHARYVADIQ